MDLLVEIISRLASILLVPTMLLLAGGFFWTLLLCGGFVAEWRRRMKGASDYAAFMAAGGRGSAPAAPVLVAGALEGRGGHAAARAKLLADLEIRARRALARLLIGVRVGPVLGLAGTLIPLGPALVALSAGDTATLAQKLVVAFSTSVLGLFISGACFVMQSTRKLWYAQDLSDAAFLLEGEGEG